jgi:hypothetical protein
MAVTEVLAESGKTYTARIHVRSPMTKKLLLAVVWIALAGGIAALIIFPPDSVLTAEFRH